MEERRTMWSVYHWRLFYTWLACFNKSCFINISFFVLFEKKKKYMFYSLCLAVTCPATMEYSECGSACPLTCSNPFSHQISCLSGCVDGCHCPANLWWDGNRCVEKQKCSCNHAGVFYKHLSIRTTACEEWYAWISFNGFPEIKQILRKKNHYILQFCYVHVHLSSVGAQQLDMHQQQTLLQYITANMYACSHNLLIIKFWAKILYRYQGISAFLMINFF